MLALLLEFGAHDEHIAVARLTNSAEIIKIRWIQSGLIFFAILPISPINQQNSIPKFRFSWIQILDSAEFFNHVQQGRSY
jgi:hypothetical protein